VKKSPGENVIPLDEMENAYEIVVVNNISTSAFISEDENRGM